MRAFRWLLICALSLTCALPAIAGDGLFEFERLRGIPTGNLVIRNIPGGGVPWTIAEGATRLGEDGTLTVGVRGLVIAATGVNPVSQFMATLSCFNADGTLNNIDTSPVPATTTGDADIEEVLTLPTTCLAPIVFVRAGLDTNTRWFAVTGF